VLTRVRAATGVALAFGGPIGPDGVRLSRFCGPTAGTLRGLRLDLGHGLGGRVAATRRPTAVDDYFTSRAITHEYDHLIRVEGLRAVMAVPVVVAREPVAVLYGALRDGGTIGDRVADTIVEEARALEQQLVVEQAMRAARDSDPDQALLENRLLRARLRDAHAWLRVLTARAEPSEERPVDGHTEPPRKAGRPGSGGTLTARELDVVTLVANGLSNPRIAAALNLEVSTVKGYMKAIMGKLDAGNRHEAVVQARRIGLIP
jgi:DNA-binding CsgD family transcriptional regulator